MYYKQDWEKAKERLLAFWEGELIDRCCVAVHRLRKTSKMSAPLTMSTACIFNGRSRAVFR